MKFLISEAKLAEPFLLALDLDNSLLTPSSMNLMGAENKKIAMLVGKLIIDHFFGENNRVSNANLLKLMHVREEIYDNRRCIPDIIFQYQTQDKFIRPLWKTAELMNQHIPVFFYEFGYESDLGRRGIEKDKNSKGIKGENISDEHKSN